MEFQLHSLQVGAADTLIAELLDQVRAVPNWEQTTLVVTSDHGSNLTPDLGRMRITDENREEAFRAAVRQGAGTDDGEHPRQRPGDRCTVDRRPRRRRRRLGLRRSLSVRRQLADDRAAGVDGRLPPCSTSPGGGPMISPTATTGPASLPSASSATSSARTSQRSRSARRASTSRRSTRRRRVRRPPHRRRGDAVRHLRHGAGPSAAGVARRRQRPIAGVIGGYVPAGDGWTFIGFLGDVYRGAATTWRSTR